MCFLVSVSQENHAVKKQIDIPVILETILYESAQRKVTVSCDMVVNNKAATPVVLYITHPDDVEGRLATEDWFSPPGVHPDHRATLVCAIYGKTFWAVSPEDRMLEFANPTESSVGSIGRETRLRAKAISRI